jgi:hypothetical protein
MRAHDRVAELRSRRERDERWDRDQVIGEFGGDSQAMADEILRLRHGVRQISDAVDLIQRGAPFFGILRPGPYWKDGADGD